MHLRLTYSYVLRGFAGRCTYTLEPPSIITIQIHDQINQRPHYIIAPRILIPAAILAIARIEKDLLGFLPYGRQPLGGARVATVEVGRFGGLVAHFRVVLDDMLDICESGLGNIESNARTCKP